MLNEGMMRDPVRRPDRSVYCGTSGRHGSGTASEGHLVMVAGCIREQPDKGWRVVNATEPKPSNAVAPPASELPTPPVVGTKQFQLIGVSVFDLPRYKDQTVVLKGVLVPATPLSRLNVTSIVGVAPTCAAAK